MGEEVDMKVVKRLSVSDKLLLSAIEEISDEIADLQDQMAEKKNHRDDLIRKGMETMTKAAVARAADLSVEQVRNIEAFRYSRESRRRKQRNPGPERD